MHDQPVRGLPRHVTMHFRCPGAVLQAIRDPTGQLITQALAATSGARHNRAIGIPPASRTVAATTNTYSAIGRYAWLTSRSRSVTGAALLLARK